MPKWETLSADQKELYLRQIDVWAAYMAYTDNEIGRIIDTIEKLGEFDNTLIIWVCGDNGMSAEGSLTERDQHAQHGVNLILVRLLRLVNPPSIAAPRDDGPTGQ